MVAAITPEKKNPLAAPRKKIDATGMAAQFAANLRSRCDQKEWGPSQLRDEMGHLGRKVSVELVHKWLNGQRYPRPDDLVALGWLLSEDGDWRHLFPMMSPPRRRSK